MKHRTYLRDYIRIKTVMQLYSTMQIPHVKRCADKLARAGVHVWKGHEGWRYAPVRHIWRYFHRDARNPRDISGVEWQRLRESGRVPIADPEVRRIVVDIGNLPGIGAVRRHQIWWRCCWRGYGTPEKVCHGDFWDIVNGNQKRHLRRYLHGIRKD